VGISAMSMPPQWKRGGGSAALLESVHYRGGWQRFFSRLSLTATPLAILASALITIPD
jgi:hypothetical protein